MTKRTVLFLLCAIYLIPAFSQSWDEVKHNSNLYICGEGWGSTVEEADQQALAALISKISVVVSSNFTITEDERTTNGVLDAKSYTNSKVQTYSSATLTNTERIVIDNNPNEVEVHIGRFIKRTELNRIFEGRIRSLKEYIRLGMVAEKGNKIDDALRNYYWAFSLLKSVQHPSEITIDNQDGSKEIYPLTWLPEKINDIFNNLNVKISNIDDSNVDLYFTYCGNPVGSLDFTYFDGRNWSNISSVKNGLATMEFTEGIIPENIQVNYEYAYRSQAHINLEIKSVLDVVKGKSFRKSRVNLSTKKRNINTSAQNFSLSSHGSNINAIALLDDSKEYEIILSTVVKAIKNKTYDSNITHLFTEDGLDMFKRLIKYGRARILNDQGCTFNQFGDEVVARSISMAFNFKNGIRRTFTEDVVFTFNKEKKIDCIAFGLDQKAQSDIMNKDVWPIEARMSIMEFLENYKTAYALKRMDYLRTIFDDNAVIIVGHVATKLERVEQTDGTQIYHTNKHVKRIRYNKEQYLKRLESCFRSNEFVNIRFANNDVRKAFDGEEYGIQIKQDYYSTNYGDEGYLYIQVDLSDKDKPIIKVRTWQPEPDPEIGLFGIGDF